MEKKETTENLINLTEKLSEDNAKLTRILNKQAEKLRCVGVRWYGHGAFTCHFDKTIGGNIDLVLSPSNREGVVDFKTWLKIASNPAVKAGVLIRDDSVIDALGIDELSAEPDKLRNPNAFSDEQGLDYLSKPMPQFKKICSEFTDKFPFLHLLGIYKENKLDNRNVLAYIKSQYHKMNITDKYNSCIRYELFDAARIRDIDYERMTEKEIVKALIEYDIKDLETDEEL